MALLIDRVDAFADNYIWLLHDEASGETAAVDPGQPEPVLGVLKFRGWRLNWILSTHHHWDHTGANLTLKEQTGCRIAGAAHDRHRIPGIDVLLHDGDNLHLGEFTAAILSTPGHTTGHVCFWFAGVKALFCGDTLFSLGCGRLFEGDAITMMGSLNRICALPADTRVYCAHEYTQINGCFARVVDPENVALLARLAVVDELRASGRPTVPVALETELLTNPFLRSSDPGIADRVGLHGAPARLVFAALREMKDNFR